MSKDFRDLTDAGQQLAAMVNQQPVAVIALIGQGAEIAIAVARKFGVRVIPALLTRDADTNEVIAMDCPRSLTEGLVYVVDDAIETGHTTRVAAKQLKALGYEQLQCAVPICPRTTAADLTPQLGEILAVVRPMIHRSLEWHYEEIPATSPESALRLISEYNASL